MPPGNPAIRGAVSVPFEVALKHVMDAFSIPRSLAELNLRAAQIYTPDAADVWISELKSRGQRPLPKTSPKLSAFSSLVSRICNDTGRGAAAVVHMMKEMGCTPESPDTLVNEICDKLRRSTWTRVAMCNEVARRTGYSAGTVSVLMTRFKLNFRDPDAIEPFVARVLQHKQEADANAKRTSFKPKAPGVASLQGGRTRVIGEEVRGHKPISRGHNIWQPDALPGEPENHGKQWEFLRSIEDIVGMEGGKGSGKTDLLIFDCIRPEKLGNPVWHGVIFRREYKRLTEVIDRARYWFSRLPQLRAHWQGSESRFVFPSGAWLAFHNVEYLGDEQKYQGWQITDLKFDQLEEFEESQFDYLMLQNRSGDPRNLRCTVRFTANPMGIGHKWVKARFIDGKEPMLTHDILVELDGIKYSRTFKRIHATVFDNPLLAKDERYIATLATDPNPIRRKAMFRGDWDVVLGQFFDSFTSEVHVVSSWELPLRWSRVAGLDYGRNKILEFLARDHEGNVYCEWEFILEPGKEDHPNGYTADEFGELSGMFMLERNLGAGLVVIADTNMWSATGRDIGSDKIPALIVQNIWNRLYKEKGLNPPVLIPVSKRASEEYNYRVACNEATRSFLRYEITPEGKITRQPKLFFLKRCNRIIETLPSLVADESDPMDIGDGQYDHAYDAFKMPFMQVFASKPEDRPPTAEQKWERQNNPSDVSRRAALMQDWRVGGW